MNRDLNTNIELVELNGHSWYIQEIDKRDGNLDCFVLYNAEGEFVNEFTDYSELNEFIKIASV